MKERREIIIIGAGAIGRGYLPWILDESYDLVFIDSNQSIANALAEKKSFKSHRTRDGLLEPMTVQVKSSYTPLSFVSTEHLKLTPNPAAVFINVGPRNCAAAAKLVKGVSCPVILCENDPATVEIVKQASGLENVFFAVPDVITSNTAPEDLLNEDPLAVITECGEMFIDSRVCQAGQGITGRINWCDESELMNQWIAKLFLHNTPHCVAAYLGAMAGSRYVHDAMMVSSLNSIVRGAMNEMLATLKQKFVISHAFLEWYAEKEISRFENPLLHDPVSRVAREPLRKLELDGRLLGAAQMCLSFGIVPENIFIGIVSAIHFENRADADHHLSFMRKALPLETLLTHILGLRKGEALQMALSSRFEPISKRLNQIGLKV